MGPFSRGCWCEHRQALYYILILCNFYSPSFYFRDYKYYIKTSLKQFMWEIKKTEGHIKRIPIKDYKVLTQDMWTSYSPNGIIHGGPWGRLPQDVFTNMQFIYRDNTWIYHSHIVTLNFTYSSYNLWFPVMCHFKWWSSLPSKNSSIFINL